MQETIADFQVGTILSTKPKNGKWVLNSVLGLDEQNNYLEIGLRQEYADSLLMPGEKMEIIASIEGFFYNAMATVLDIIIASSPQRVKIKVESISKIENKREEKRYRVHMHATLKGEEISVPEASIVSDISSSGIGLISRQNLTTGSQVFIDISINEEELLTLKCKVVRKSAKGYNIEYGLKTSAVDKENRNILNKLLDKLDERDTAAISKIKKIKHNNDVC